MVFSIFVLSAADIYCIQDGSPLLTCSLFTECLTTSTADNCGGQTQADGSVDFIINSDGFCKKTPTA
jgi:hypothetical protein